MGPPNLAEMRIMLEMSYSHDHSLQRIWLFVADDRKATSGWLVKEARCGSLLDMGSFFYNMPWSLSVCQDFDHFNLYLTQIQKHMLQLAQGWVI